MKTFAQNAGEEGVISRAPRRGAIVTASHVARDGTYIFRFRDRNSDTLIRPQVRMLDINPGGGKSPRP